MRARRARRRRRLATLLGVALLSGAGAAVASLAGGGAPRARAPAAGGTRPPATSVAGAVPPAPASHQPLGAPYPVGLRIIRLVDRTRSIRLANGTRAPRVLVTYVRYPSRRPARGTDLIGAPPVRSGAPFPLIVFGHGFSVTPTTYQRLLRAWARAGYVVAAPAFPLENANAPGGPDETDLVNQPRDISYVISALLTGSASKERWLAGLIDPSRIAVAGQSDGGDTALAVAYDRPFRDARVGAAVILSGAEIPTLPAFGLRSGGPPLMATQGTADTINPPSDTEAFFARAARPKYLLSLLGAGHLPPYTYQQPQLGIVERVTTAFLDHYLKGTAPLARIAQSARVRGVAALRADP